MPFELVIYPKASDKHYFHVLKIVNLLIFDWSYILNNEATDSRTNLQINLLENKKKTCKFECETGVYKKYYNS